MFDPFYTITMLELLKCMIGKWKICCFKKKGEILSESKCNDELDFTSNGKLVSPPSKTSVKYNTKEDTCMITKKWWCKNNTSINVSDKFLIALKVHEN